MKRDPLSPFFSLEEQKRLGAMRRKVRRDRAQIVFCVYENPFAKGGGVFVAAQNHCAQLAESGEKVIAVSPYHSKLKSCPKPSDVQKIGACKVEFNGKPVAVELFEHIDTRAVRWILPKAKGFFEANGGPDGKSPYIYHHSRTSNRLLRDSLFLCKAIPAAVKELGLTRDLIFHLQDWELVATALTVKEALLRVDLKSAAVVLTSHNPYDHVLPKRYLKGITQRTDRAPKPDPTVYQYMLPLLDATLGTVSKTFARELVTDPLQTAYFADHLQEAYRRQGLVGIDNGLFGRLVAGFSSRAIRRAKRGDFEAILKEKLDKRNTMLAMLETYRDARLLGGLRAERGRSIVELDSRIPVFFMFGRLDPGQKGFDLFANAVRRLPRFAARYILAVMVDGSPPPFYEDLERLARSRPGEVVVYPFRMDEGYLETMAGATFAVMPSLYEPFGAATEPFLAGTPVVARATGGLAEQVLDVDAGSTKATGLLFHEKVPRGTNLAQEWRRIQEAPNPSSRKASILYETLTEALVETLVRAIGIYQTDPVRYARMLAGLYDQAKRFSWKRAVQRYEKVYDRAVR